jgi:hypothetical protein
VASVETQLFIGLAVVIQESLGWVLIGGFEVGEESLGVFYFFRGGLLLMAEWAGKGLELVSGGFEGVG